MIISTPENVYRPPYEWISVLVILLVCLALLWFPMPNKIFGFTVAVLLILAIKRALSARRIMRFRRQLKVLPYYGLTADEVPVSHLGMFLGIGFKWSQTHTQRLFLAKLPDNDHLREISSLTRYVREYEMKHKHNWITKFTRSGSKLNPFKPLPPVGGKPEIHGVEIKEYNVYSDVIERVGHTLVLGTTRVGKTRLAEILVIQDIRRGDVTIFFDPKGDADMLKRMYVEAKKANRPFYMFHLGFPDSSCRYNPIGDYGRITEVATRIANQLPGEGNAASFKNFVWRYVNVLAKTMHALSISPSFKELYRVATDVDEISQNYFKLLLNHTIHNWQEEYDDYFAADDSPELKQIRAQSQKSGRSPETMKLAHFIKVKKIEDELVYALVNILSNDRTYYEKLVSSLFPLLEKLTTGDVADLISPNAEDLTDTRPIMDWQTVIATNAVVYIGLDALSDFEVAAAVGNAMFADLTSRAGKIYKFGSDHGQSVEASKRKVAIHADEFNELIGDEFIPLLNKAGGAGFQVTAYTQTWMDVEAKIGSKAKAGQIGGNLNTLVMLRVKTKETAQMLTDQLPEVKIMNATLVSGANDIAFPDSHEDFGSRNEDRIGSETVPMLSPSDLTSLPKGQAFTLINGGQLYKIRMPLPENDPNEDIPADVNEIAQNMYERNLGEITPEDWQRARFSGILKPSKTNQTEKPHITSESPFMEGEHYGR